MPRTKMDALAEQLNLDEGFNESDSKPTAKKAKRKFEQTDFIMCRSVTLGGLFLEGAKTKQIYHWSAYGDRTEVEYRDLVSEVRSKSSAVFSPWFIIEDDDFVEEFPQLKQFYINAHPVKDLKKILECPVKEMVAKIECLPQGAKETLRNITAEAVVNGELDSVVKIKALDEIFGTDLNLLASLSE